MTQERRRAKYSFCASVMFFSNPSDQGPLKEIGFCARDRMFHLYLRENYFKNKEAIDDLRGKIAASAFRHHRSFPTIEGEEVISVWPLRCPTDLEDMICIFDGVPELQASWLRASVNQLKNRAGLAADDLPYMDRHVNPKAVEWFFLNNEPRVIRKEWYGAAWFSAKGGTLEFVPYMPSHFMDSAVTMLRQAGAEVSRPAFSPERTSLSFTWRVPRKDLGETLEEIKKISGTLPPIVRCSVHAQRKVPAPLGQNLFCFMGP